MRQAHVKSLISCPWSFAFTTHLQRAGRPTALKHFFCAHQALASTLSPDEGVLARSCDTEGSGDIVSRNSSSCSWLFSFAPAQAPDSFEAFCQLTHVQNSKTSALRSISKAVRTKFLHQLLVHLAFLTQFKLHVRTHACTLAQISQISNEYSYTQVHIESAVSFTHHPPLPVRALSLDLKLINHLLQPGRILQTCFHLVTYALLF